MIKAVLLSLLAFFFFCSAAESRHICVFSLDQPSFIHEWDNIHPDILYPTRDWRYLDEFLKKVQDRYYYDAEELVIDFDTHGDQNGYLWVGNKTSMGSVLSRIEQFFPNRPNLVVTMEACYAGRCYKLTGRGAKDGYLPGGISTPPPFPVYGIFDDQSNFGNLQFLEYINKDTQFQLDLREYEVKPLKPVEFHWGLNEMEARACQLYYDLQAALNPTKLWSLLRPRLEAVCKFGTGTGSCSQ